MDNIDSLMYLQGITRVRKKFKKETVRLKKENCDLLGNEEAKLVKKKQGKKPKVTLKNDIVALESFPSVITTIETPNVVEVSSSVTEKVPPIVAEKPKVVLKQNDIVVKKKTTIIVKRFLKEEKDLCNKMEKIVLDNLIETYFISNDNNVVSCDYNGEKRMCYRKSNNYKNVLVLDDQKREEIKKNIPVKFLNVFHRLKKYHIMDCYGSNVNKIDAWNSLSPVSKQRWQSINFDTQQICNMLLDHHGLESMLLWASLFS